MRIFSGIQPTGAKHLGNYIGAIRNYVGTQDKGDAFFCIVDLHSITTDYDPDDLRESTLSLAALLLAAGLDPERCTLFLQSHVRAHPEGAWLLGAVTSYGELRRMTQFKEKGDQQDFISAGLFTYPVLQAADILLYQTDLVPIGDDQRQHLELTRNVAERFNSRFGETFRLPDAMIPEVGGRIMDLQEPEKKMSTTGGTAQGTVGVLDPPETIRKKFKSAVTDSGSRGAPRPRREGGHLEPDRDHVDRHRRGDPGDRGPLRRGRLRHVQGGGRRGGRRGARPDPARATKSCAPIPPSSSACSASAPTRPARSRPRRSSRCTSAWASSGPDSSAGSNVVTMSTVAPHCIALPHPGGRTATADSQVF